MSFVLLVAVGSGPVWAADGRAFEMVSPVDKNGGDIPGDSVSAVASADGNAIAYSSRASFGDTVGSGPAGQTMYVARRGSDGWHSHGVTPTPQYDAFVSLGVPSVLDFSKDLRHAVVFAHDLPAVSGDLPTPNIYAEDTLTNELSLVTVARAGTQSVFAMAVDYATPNPVGVSDDSRHIAFTGRLSQLLPEAPFGVPSVYEWDNGTLRIASVLPNGEIATAGAVLASPNGSTQQAYRYTVSPDGSRVMFISPAAGPFDPPRTDGQLYSRIDHARTVWVSQPETREPAPMPEEVVLQQVTGDSRHVIFTTTSRLLDGDTNDGPDIYLYTDTASPERDRNLTLVTSTGDVPGRLDFNGTAVIGSSADGSRVYFLRGSEVLMWHGGEIRTVALNVTVDPDPRLLLSATVSTPGAARVTPDGRYLAYMARREERTQLYLYDAVSDQLQCISCPSDGFTGTSGSIIPSVTTIFPKLSLPGVRPSFLAEDGRVFFSTAAPLVLQDVNSVTDAYEFDPATGGVSLISTGKGAAPAAFVDASPSGDNVFVVTRQPLVKADRDSFVDLYDARVGGGFPDAPDPLGPCLGDACQPAAPGDPGDLNPGTSAFDGDGDAPLVGARLRVLRSRTVGWRAVLRVRSSSAGTVRWAGSGLREGRRQLSGPGTYRIRIVLTARFRERLERRGVLRARVRLTLAPVGGASSTATATLTFKSSSSKKGR